MSDSDVSALSVSDLNHIFVGLVSKQSGGTVSSKSPDGITPTSEPIVLNAPAPTGDIPKSKTPSGIVLGERSSEFAEVITPVRRNERVPNE